MNLFLADHKKLIMARSLAYQLVCLLVDKPLQDMYVLDGKAGLGRTGTMLVCVLVYKGMMAMNAIGQLRMINRLYIQTDEQLDFVNHFETYKQTQVELVLI